MGFQQQGTQISGVLLCLHFRLGTMCQKDVPTSTRRLSLRSKHRRELQYFTSLSSFFHSCHTQPCTYHLFIRIKEIFILVLKFCLWKKSELLWNNTIIWSYDTHTMGLWTSFKSLENRLRYPFNFLISSISLKKTHCAEIEASLKCAGGLVNWFLIICKEMKRSTKAGLRKSFILALGLRGKVALL